MIYNTFNVGYKFNNEMGAKYNVIKLSSNDLRKLSQTKFL